MSMFCGAKSFNKPLNNWNLEKIHKMDFMFSKTHLFNQPLNKWNVSKAISFVGMFSESLKFNQSLNDWNIDLNRKLPPCIMFIFHQAISFDMKNATWFSKEHQNKIGNMIINQKQLKI